MDLIIYSMFFNIFSIAIVCIYQLQNECVLQTTLDVWFKCSSHEELIMKKLDLKLI